LHAATTRTGQVALRRGRHAIEVDYFQAGGAMGLRVEYAGPSLPRQVIPPAALSH